MIHSMPDLAALVDPLLGCAYEQYNCWALLRHLYGQAWDIHLDEDPAAAIAQVQEIWFAGDTADPLALSRPWDIWIMKYRGVTSQHVGIVLNALQLVHTRKRTGVCLESLHHGKHFLLQMARLRQLL